MKEFSMDAQRICARWFQNGDRNSLKSHPPHDVLAKYGSAMDELVEAGAVIRKPFNGFGVILYQGTNLAMEIGMPLLRKQALEFFGHEVGQ